VLLALMVLLLVLDVKALLPGADRRSRAERPEW
jgi:hypothetical protein